MFFSREHRRDDTRDDVEVTPSCASCDEAVARGHVVHLGGAFARIYCSMSCFRIAARAEWRQRWAERVRGAIRLGVLAIVVGAWITPHEEPERHPIQPVAAAPLVRAAMVAAGAPATDDRPDGWYGPAWPPTEQSVLAALGRDAWVHPLAGPVRRMPRTDSRVFGAVRPGNRAIECRNGHCGVDLGGEIWGEHIHAVHDGVVDFVQRGLNPDHGGRFVRLSHRNGTLYTLYFHLAAIPRGLERGVKVKSGQVIGLLGDSGVKESAPHLHFALTIRPVKDGPERYIDPEPLVALWPLRVPVDGSEVGWVTTVAEPGVPLGSQNLRPGRKRGAPVVARGAAKPRGGAAPADDVTPASTEVDDTAAESESLPEAPSAPED